MKKRREMIVVCGFCLFILIGAILPFAGIPSGIVNAESQMIDTYGSRYSDLDTSSMRSVPYSIYDNLFGIPIDTSSYNVEYDIRYLNNGQDSFFFDWYCPVGDGPFPVIIAIHGGAWVLGNKGFSNIPLFNHYFASKGYVVFDINYGLLDLTTLPEENMWSALADLDFGLSMDYNASYNIQDQIENIGYFTKMMDLNSSKYKADLNNIFVAGRSAGGNMASLVTLGYKNPLFLGNFSSNMTVRGGVWIYPATNITRDDAGTFDSFVEGNLPIDEQYKKLFAASLISNSTDIPPIFIVHGSKDGLADYTTQGLGFYQLAQSLGRKCVLITIPFAGHGFDYDFYGFGGQISTYYIERFLALEVGGG
jgi:acetyl esterase/lipase